MQVIGHPDIIDHSFVTVAVGRIANHNFMQAVATAGTNLVMGIEVVVVKELMTQAVEQANTGHIKPKDFMVHCRVQLAGTVHNQFQMMVCQPCLIQISLNK